MMVLVVYRWFIDIHSSCSCTILSFTHDYVNRSTCCESYIGDRVDMWYMYYKSLGVKCLGGKEVANTQVSFSECLWV